ncbi:MAG: PAS domain-containing protein [Rhodospirillaceae bacterium]|nr:PAS domain-containing protein [Rhodospirillaceae bacterium]
MTFRLLPMEAMTGQRHRLAMEVWADRRGDRMAPARRDLEPWDLKSILPYVTLLDVIEDPLDFRCRLVGTKVREIHGIELTGKSVRALGPPSYADRVWEHLTRLIERKEPQLCLVEYTNRDILLRSFTVLRLPLSNDGRTVNMILAVHEPHEPVRTGALLRGRE